MPQKFHAAKISCLKVVHKIEAKLVSNWEQNMLYTKN